MQQYYNNFDNKPEDEILNNFGLRHENSQEKEPEPEQELIEIHVEDEHIEAENQPKNEHKPTENQPINDNNEDSFSSKMDNLLKIKPLCQLSPKQEAIAYLMKNNAQISKYCDENSLSLKQAIEHFSKSGFKFTPKMFKENINFYKK